MFILDLVFELFIFYMTAEKGKGEGMGMGGDYEQSITNVTGDEPW